MWPDAPDTREARRSMLWRSAVTVGLLGLVMIAGSPGITFQAALTVFIFLGVGLPHGALDHVIAERDLGLHPIALYSGYLAVALVIFIAWCLVPWLTIGMFLLLSAWHFGEGDVRGLDLRRGTGAILVASRGILLIGALLFAWPDLAESYWGTAAADLGGVGRSWWIFGGLVGQHVLAILVCVKNSWNLRSRLVTDALILGTWMWMAEPLLAFALYFGLWHSFDHMLLLRGALTDQDQRMRWTTLISRTLPNTLASALGMVVFTIAALAILGETTVFTASLGGLAAVATPHVLLVEWWRRTRVAEGSGPTSEPAVS